MKFPHAIILAISTLSLSACQTHEEPHEAEAHKIVVTSPMARDVTIAQPYVCQIHSRRHIEVCSMDGGYLKEIRVREGQKVKKGDLLFKVIPVIYKAKLDAEQAEAKLAELELKFSKQLAQDNAVSINEVGLYKAKLAKAKAKAQLAKAEWEFTNVTAQFDGIVDRLHEQLGSLIKEGDVLTTLSDNSVMWVYFNVPESQYLEYKAKQGKGDSKNPQKLKLSNAKVELRLANGRKFDHTAADTITVEGQFNNETGNIPFRADFSNPDGLLRHGQTGTVLIHQTLKNAVVIPQRAVFEILDRQYVYVVNKDGVVHQRQITIAHELDDIFVIGKGLTAKDKIVLEGVRQVRDGEKTEYEFQKPEVVLSHLKFHAE